MKLSRMWKVTSIIAAFAVVALAQDNHTAPEVTNNNQWARYTAILQKDKPIEGQITVGPDQFNIGVEFQVDFIDFPSAEEGPFLYHVHNLPVPPDGNCTGTGGHLDPYNRGEQPPCKSFVIDNSTQLEDPQDATCQVGDLSGKHGSINDTAQTHNYHTNYPDLYFSLQPGTPAFVGNRSIVIHASNGTRLNCGNFTGGNVSTSSPLGNSSVSGTSAPPKPSGNAASTTTIEMKGIVNSGILGLVLMVALGALMALL